MKNGGCLQSNLVGCIEKNLETCLNCASGFYLKNNKCLKAIKGCNSYDTAGSCQTCLSGFTLANGACIEKSIIGCKTQSNGNCV